jgi:L-histidine N-alpha-methyltransferase
MRLAPITIAIHAFGRNWLDALVADVREGLTRSPKSLPSRWFYDERGSELFEKITALPEYYQTRTEADILRAHAADIVGAVRPETIVELGAGFCTKTRHLLRAAKEAGTIETFLPMDISEAILQRTARDLVEEFDGLKVYAMVGDFVEHIDQVPRLGGRQLVVFLGSTVGNFDRSARANFLRNVRALLEPGDAFLLGVDLVKDRRELVAAYDDAQGVTAEFNLNLLRMINRELSADFNLEAFEHVALYNEAESRIEMLLRSARDQTVRIPGAGIEVGYAKGELMLTEISVKFTPESVAAEFAAAGIELTSVYTDVAERFALVLGSHR